MPYIDPVLQDGLLGEISGSGRRLDICTQLPTTYTQATSTYTVANKTGVTVGAPQAGAIDGRRVVVPAQTDGVITGNETTGTHWAVTNGSDRLYAAGSLVEGQIVYSENTFSSAAFSIALRNPTE